MTVDEAVALLAAAPNRSAAVVRADAAAVRAARLGPAGDAVAANLDAAAERAEGAAADRARRVAADPLASKILASLRAGTARDAIALAVELATDTESVYRSLRALQEAGMVVSRGRTLNRARWVVTARGRAARPPKLK